MNKTFIVEGMSCAACSSAVERIMNKQEAVESASVNLTTKKLVMSFDESLMGDDKIISLVEKAGFTAQEHIETKHVVLPIDGMT
jgi:Cu+-exporting ATPase